MTAYNYPDKQSACSRCKRPKPKGYVYFAQSRLTRLIKIGYSTNPSTRLNGLSNNLFESCDLNLPDRWDMGRDEVHYVAVMAAPKMMEKILQNTFAHSHFGGEWYYLSAPLWEFICSLQVACGEDFTCYEPTRPLKMNASDFHGLSSNWRSPTKNEDPLRREGAL